MLPEKQTRPIAGTTVTAYPNRDHAAALAKVLTLAAEQLNTQEATPTAAMRAQFCLMQTAFDTILQGVCIFDSEKRLVFSNRRYFEIYRIDPDSVPAGATLRDISERRIAAGTFALAIEDFLLINETVNSGSGVLKHNFQLPDGRTIQINHHRLPDNGWVGTHEDITELLATRTVGTHHISLQTMIDWVPDYLWVKDTESRFVVVNKALATDAGLLKTTDVIGLTDFDLHPPELARAFHAKERAILQSGAAHFLEEETIHVANGVQKWVLSTKVPLRNERDEIYGIVGIGRDVTERKRAEILRNGQAQILEMIATSERLEDVLMQLAQMIEAQLNGIACSILLLDESGQRFKRGAAPSLPDTFLRAIEEVEIGPCVGSCGAAVHRREAVIVSDIATDPLWADYREFAAAHDLRSCWSTPVLSHENAVLGTFALYSKSAREPTASELSLVTSGVRLACIAIERKLSEDRIHFMANHDSLTGLPNRALLKDRLSQALLHARQSRRWVSVIFIDLDKFKVINDSLGHNAGDDLLRIAATRMVDCVGPTNTVVRLGGDEFVILLMDQPAEPMAITEIADAIRRSLGNPIVIKGHEIKMTCSMGISNFPDDGSDAEALIANADAAMYRAKDNGRDSYQFYTPDLNATAQERFLLLEALRMAVDRAEFVLFYQPQVRLADNSIFAIEALVRWRHPTLGLVPPITFIPLAEETGLIVEIGDWVLHEACRQNKAWQDAGHPKITVCVNVSARQFIERDLVDRVIAALDATGLEAKYLELELTESLIMRDVPQAIRTMEHLQALGVTLAIDDFGTGYSSLSALKSFPVARLKIDKSFIADLATNENDRAVTSAVISLGQKLKLKIIAEGVETQAQLDFLRGNNCDEMQGYHFCSPVPAADLEKMFAERK